MTSGEDVLLPLECDTEILLEFSSFKLSGKASLWSITWAHIWRVNKIKPHKGYWKQELEGVYKTLKESILQVRTVCAKTIHKRKYALRNRMEACVAEGRGAVCCEMWCVRVCGGRHASSPHLLLLTYPSIAYWLFKAYAHLFPHFILIPSMWYR